MLERAVWFDRLPKIFNWYESIIEKFIPNSKVGKYQHRVKDLQKKIYWEITRCEDAGIDAQEQALFGLNDLGNGYLLLTARSSSKFYLENILKVSNSWHRSLQSLKTNWPK